MNPSIFGQTLEKYSNCKSYIDSGSEYGLVANNATFRTYFFKPDLFKFEYTSRSGNSLSIRSIGNETILTARGETKNTDLKMAISAITPFNRLPTFILKLLLPDLEFDYLDFTKHKPFVENIFPAEEGFVWVGSDRSSNLHTENFLIDSTTKRIVERKVLVYTTEDIAAKNAAEYFKNIDPDLSNSYSDVSERGARVGFKYGSRHEKVIFDDFSDELIKEKFNI